MSGVFKVVKFRILIVYAGTNTEAMRFFWVYYYFWPMIYTFPLSVANHGG